MSVAPKALLLCNDQERSVKDAQDTNGFGCMKYGLNGQNSFDKLAAPIWAQLL